MLQLYTYFRSSAAYRVRIALALKGLAYESLPIHLLHDGGQQFTSAYRATNPQALVPSLQTDAGVLTQSLAIIEYLEETAPGQGSALLPADALGRARVRALAQAVACDIHPLNNLRVLRYLTRELAVDEEAKNRWYRHWVEEGLAVFERRLDDGQAGRFCHGDTPTLADCCLVPQVYNAQRFKVDLGAYPEISRINAECMRLPEFAAAAPENQPDAA